MEPLDPGRDKLVQPPVKKPTPKKHLRKVIWQKRVLACVSECGNLAALCRQLGLDEAYVYHCKRKDKDFGAAWAKAEEEALDALEHEAHRRAKVHSDRLIEFILKHKRPKVWGDLVEGMLPIQIIIPPIQVDKDA